VVRLLVGRGSSSARRPAPVLSAEQIFGIKTKEPLPIVRELGMANFSLGATGALSLARPDFVLPVAIVAAIFYGLAGLGHGLRRERNASDTFAMWSDFFALAVLGGYAAFTFLGS
jgi:hypothetical protein